MLRLGQMSLVKFIHTTLLLLLEQLVLSILFNQYLQVVSIRSYLLLVILHHSDRLRKLQSLMVVLNMLQVFTMKSLQQVMVKVLKQLLLLSLMQKLDQAQSLMLKQQIQVKDILLHLLILMVYQESQDLNLQVLVELLMLLFQKKDLVHLSS